MPRIPNSTWAEIRTAYASGIGLREIARNMGIPAGTVLARAKREGWTQKVKAAKALAKRDKPQAINATPFDAAAATMQERGQRHVEKMSSIVDGAMTFVERMNPGEVLQGIDRVEKLDKIGRRTYGLDDASAAETKTWMPIQINFG